jgi:hypothetical protein
VEAAAHILSIRGVCAHTQFGADGDSGNGNGNGNGNSDGVGGIDYSTSST